MDVKDIDELTIRIVSVNNLPAERAASQIGLRILPQDEYESIQSVMENGLQTANLQLYDIRFEQGKNLLKGYSGSTYAAIPYGVTHIGYSSGLREKGLTSVKIPSSVTIIAEIAFWKNLLTSVTIPDSVTYIGDTVFFSNRLTSVFLGNSVTYIGDSAFNMNNSLSSVTIPDSVTYLGDSVFDGNLKSITIGANVQTGRYYSFGKDIYGDAYTKNNRKAGTYTSTDGKNWNYSARR